MGERSLLLFRQKLFLLSEKSSRENTMIKPSELTWDDVVQVGPGTLGGELFALLLVAGGAFRRSQGYSRACKTSWRRTGAFPRSLRRVGAPRRLLLAPPCLIGVWHYSSRTVFVAPITDGATTGAAESSTGLPSRSRPQPTFSTHGIRQELEWVCVRLFGKGQREPAAAAEI